MRDHDAGRPPGEDDRARRMAIVRSRIAALDARADAAFDRLRGNRVADRIFYGASALGDHSLIWFIVGAARALGSERRWRSVVRMAAALGVESVLVNIVLKSFVRRRRPPSAQPRPLPLRQPVTSSFPSGHATSAFCAAGLLSEDDWLWPAYYGLAVVVASSRIYVRIHHTSDVVAGAVIGAVLGRIGRRLFPLVSRPDT
ncbi:MAG TPA: phosphatase PAP2 family protein [Acidimicrobiales bacterium]|nr:phosphatase PAP2 family protein [Acidimicrobiales bacterium]